MPPALNDMLGGALLFRCWVALAELALGVGEPTRGFALRIVPGIVLAMLAAWMTAALLGL